MFWNKFVELCNKKNTTPNAVGKEIGISSAAITYWKNGSQPRDTAIKKIADYFNLPDDYFKEIKNEPTIIPYSGNEKVGSIVKLLLNSSIDDNDLHIIEAVLDKYKK